MKTLPLQFTFDESDFLQLARSGDVVLLERTKRRHRSPTYEVVIVQHHAAIVIHGREYPEREAMPPTAAWGTLGWTFTTRLAATRKFNELVQEHTEANLFPTPFSAHASKPH